MATQPTYDKPVSIEAYLSMEFEHDCEYVDGVIEKRDLGEFEHSYVHLLVTLFNNKRREWGLMPFPNSGCRRERPISGFRM
jgi:hypothetical protein